MRVSEVGAEDERAVDAFIAARAASPTDLPAWRRVVRDAYGITSRVLVARDGENIAGALTLFEIRHPAFGRYLTTAPFGNDGGLHADDAAARAVLLAEARALADARGVDYLVVRTRDATLEGFAADAQYRSAVIDLRGGSEAVWEQRLPAKTRNQVRRGMKEGFSIASGPDQLGAFFDVFHAHMRDLGSPAHSRHFYEAIVEHLGDCAEFLVLRDGATLVASALLFRVNGIAMNLHTVALREYNRRCPNYLLYWRMIESSCVLGCTSFDMGRSVEGSPNLDFKRNWGPEIVPLGYHYYLRRRGDVPNVDPRNPRYRIAIGLWRRLPLAVTKRLGPRLIPGLA